jgi:hypothetical protein
MFEMIHAIVDTAGNLAGYALVNHFTGLALMCNVDNAYDLVQTYGSPNVIANRYSGHLLLIDVEEDMKNYTLTMNELIGKYPQLLQNMDGVN